MLLGEAKRLQGEGEQVITNGDLSIAMDQSRIDIEQLNPTIAAQDDALVARVAIRALDILSKDDLRGIKETRIQRWLAGKQVWIVNQGAYLVFDFGEDDIVQAEQAGFHPSGEQEGDLLVVAFLISKARL